MLSKGFPGRLSRQQVLDTIESYYFAQDTNAQQATAQLINLTASRHGPFQRVTTNFLRFYLTGVNHRSHYGHVCDALLASFSHEPFSVLDSTFKTLAQDGFTFSDDISLLLEVAEHSPEARAWAQEQCLKRLPVDDYFALHTALKESHYHQQMFDLLPIRWQNDLCL